MYELMKETQKMIWTFTRRSDFEEFQKIFHSKPVPDLYPQQLKSYSLSKSMTILLKCIFFYGTAKTNLAMFSMDFIETNAISDRKRIEIPALRPMV